jgi:hypothetical protein
VVPSGITGTSYIDGGVSSVLKRYYFSMLYPSTPFRTAITLLTYGDDNTEGRKKRLGFVTHPRYTPEGYAAFANSVGMIVTGATKTRDITKGIDIISRKFKLGKLNGRQRYIAPLKKASIFKSLHGHIKKTGTDYDAVLQDNITRAFMEMVLHGKAEVDAFMAVMRRIQSPLVTEHPIMSSQHSYNDLVNLYFDFAEKPVIHPKPIIVVQNARDLPHHESHTVLARVPTAVLQATGQFARYINSNAPRAILAVERFKEAMGYVAIALGNSRPPRIDAPSAFEVMSAPRLSNFNNIDNVKRLTWDV